VTLQTRGIGVGRRSPDTRFLASPMRPCAPSCAPGPWLPAPLDCVASVAAPTYRFTLRDAKDALPAIDSPVTGSGTAPIIPALLDHGEAEFAHFRSHASDRLRPLIERRYLALDPRQFAHQPVAAMRTDWQEVLRTERVFGNNVEALPPVRWARRAGRGRRLSRAAASRRAGPRRVSCSRS
jgi:hypothetical protein